MSQPIKVPKEVMELVYEQQACEILANESGFIRALVYRQKAFKLESLIWRTMYKVFPQTATGGWIINATTGIATEKFVGNKAAEVKKPRKPRAAKLAADPANSLGE